MSFPARVFGVGGTDYDGKAKMAEEHRLKRITIIICTNIMKGWSKEGIFNCMKANRVSVRRLYDCGDEDIRKWISEMGVFDEDIEKHKNKEIAWREMCRLHKQQMTIMTEQLTRNIV